MSYGNPKPPEDLEPEAAKIGEIYWVPGKGDIVVGWDPAFLDDIHQQGLTSALIDWAKRLSDRIAKEFSGRQQ